GHGGELARRNGEGAAFRHLGDAALRRPRGGRARRRSGAVALERTIAVERRAGQGLWLHRSRRLATRCLALHRRSRGAGKAGRRDRLSLVLKNRGVVDAARPDGAVTQMVRKSSLRGLGATSSFERRHGSSNFVNALVSILFL